VRRGYEAFKALDVAALQEVFAPDTVWHSAGRNWLVGDYHGLPAILNLFGTISAYSEGTYSIEVRDLLGNDDRVVGLQHITATRADGRSMSVDTVLVFEMRDGRVQETWSWPYDIYAEDEYYGTEPPPGMSRLSHSSSELA
jgi:ketosteroid isomerase-like protein